MSTGWQALRELDRDLALALLFAPVKNRELLSNITALACEAEAALKVASEPMLAAIRLQWWVEAVETGQTDQVPLAARLVVDIEAGSISKPDILGVIGLWQDRLSSDPEDGAGCWGETFAVMARLTDRGANGRGSVAAIETISDIANRIGHAQICDHAHLTTDDFELIDTPQYRWLLMLALQALYRQHGGQAESPLLIWRMLAWKYGFIRPETG